MEKIKKWKKIKELFIKYGKIIKWIIIGIFFSIAGPIFIGVAYNVPNKLIFTPWDAADMLSYYGTLLGASATIIAILISIDHAKKAAKKDKTDKTNEKYREHGTNICLKLMNSLDIKTFEKYQYATTFNESKQDLFDQIGNIEENIRDLIKDFERTYSDQKDCLISFSNWYINEIMEYVNKHCNEEILKTDNYDIKNAFRDARILRTEHKKKYQRVSNFIKMTMTTFEIFKDEEIV